MEPTKITLCPACTACPEVVVTAGEDENTVRLSHAEWSGLLCLVETGQLGAVSGPSMAQNRIFATAIVGFAVSKLDYVTSALIVLLVALGVSVSMGQLDYIRLPSRELFVGVTLYASFCRFWRAWGEVERIIREPAGTNLKDAPNC